MVTPQTQVNVARHLNLESHVGKVISVGAGGSMCGLVNGNTAMLRHFLFTKDIAKLLPFVFLIESGTVFVWGYGMLGMGPSVTELKVPTPLHQNLFGKSIFNPQVRVRSITAGLHHFAAITDKGELYMWGKNNKGSLRIGTETDMLFPYRVCSFDSVVVATNN